MSWLYVVAVTSLVIIAFGTLIVIVALAQILHEVQTIRRRADTVSYEKFVEIFGGQDRSVRHKTSDKTSVFWKSVNREGSR